MGIINFFVLYIADFLIRSKSPMYYRIFANKMTNFALD